MEVLLAERTSEEENPISVVISRLRTWLVTVPIRHRHSGIRVSLVPLALKFLALLCFELYAFENPRSN
jgi:hypothetical protein